MTVFQKLLTSVCNLILHIVVSCVLDGLVVGSIREPQATVVEHTE